MCVSGYMKFQIGTVGRDFLYGIERETKWCHWEINRKSPKTAKIKGKGIKKIRLGRVT